MILVVGGTGTLGRYLLPMLSARGSAVRILARHPSGGPAVPGVEFVAGDVRDTDVLDAALKGVTTIVSAITGFGGPDALGSRAVDRDGNLALIAAAQRAGVEHLVLLSVEQAGPRHPIELFRDKWAAEEALRSSGLAWTIIRPTAYLETWLGIIGGPLAESGRTRIFGRGRNPINFVSALDVARFVDLAISDPGLRSVVIDAPGPANLGFDELAADAEVAIGRTGTKQHMPVPMMRMAALVAGLRNPVLAAQIRAAIVMDSRDMTADGPTLRRAYPSIPLTPVADVAARMFGSREGLLAESAGA